MIITAAVFTAMPLSVSAEDSDGLEKSGEAGNNCTWAFSDNGTLTISGNGEMWGYKNSEYAPWWYLNSEITSIKLSNGLTNIGEGAFKDCEKVTNIDIPITVTTIGEKAFAGCSALSFVVIPDAVTEIQMEAFSDCTDLTYIIIGSGLQYLGGFAFSGCGSLTNITVSKNNETFDSRNNCNAIIETEYNSLVVGSANTIIPNDVTDIGYGAFYGCSGLKSIAIPDSVEYISSEAFVGCTGLTTVTIGKKVEKIYGRTFFDCKNIKSVTIPNNVTSIGAKAFGYYYDEDYNELKVEGLTVYGVKGSEAENYANKNDFKFVGIEPPAPQVIIGDLNGDNTVDVLDAAVVQKYAVGKGSISTEQIAAADVNNDGNVDVLDAADIKKYAAGIITEFKKKA